MKQKRKRPSILIRSKGHVSDSYCRPLKKFPREKTPLEIAVQSQKGRYFNATFRCAKCGHDLYRGYVYEVGDYELEICPTCRKKMLGLDSGYVHLIYTAM